MKKLLLCSLLIAGSQVQTFCSEPKQEPSFTTKAQKTVAAVVRNALSAGWYGALTAASAVTSFACYTQAIDIPFKIEDLSGIMRNPLMLLSPEYESARRNIAFLQPLPAVMFAGSAITAIGSLICAYKTLDSLRKVVTLAD